MAFKGTHLEAEALNLDTLSYLISDLRIIKQLRYPDKKLIIGTWLNFDFSKNNLNNHELRRLAEQWLLTPNYSAHEKHEIFKYDKKRFIDYVNSFSKASWNLSFSTEKEGQISGLRMNGVLQTLFESSTEFVDFTSTELNYSKLLKEWLQLREEDKVSISSTVEQFSDSRLKRALKLIINYQKPDYAFYKSKLIESIEIQNKNDQSYSMYSDKNYKSEILQINNL